MNTLKLRAVTLLSAASVALASPALSLQESSEPTLPSPAPSSLAGHERTSNSLQSDSDSSWDFMIQPYVLFATIEGDVQVGRAGNTPVDVDFGTILENLKMGAMLHGEAHHKSGWGLVLDYAFMRLGADRAGQLGVVLDAEVEQGALEAFVNRRYELESGGTLDAFGGVRWWQIDMDLTLAPGPVDRGRDVDWVDPVVGAKITSPFAGDWYYMGRGDIGGFGVGSEFSWSAAAGLGYNFNETIGLEFQYKLLDVDYEENLGTADGFRYDTLTHGPLIGLTINF